MTRYADFHRRSLQDREAFWSEQAALIDWKTPAKQICDYSNPPFARWFVGGTTNLCHNAVDRHAAAHPDRRALIWVSTEVDKEVVYTFAELQREVECMASMLAELGVKAGDRVLVYMPMIPEAVFAMLACTRIGALHSVVFGGFASVSLASRIDDAEPAVIVLPAPPPQLPPDGPTEELAGRGAIDARFGMPTYDPPTHDEEPG